MKQKKELPGLVVFAILTLVTTLTWLSLEVYRSLTQRTPTEVPATVIQPIEPTLDQITLEGLVNKVYLEDAEIGDTVLSNPNTESSVKEIEGNTSQEESASQSAEIQLDEP